MLKKTIKYTDFNGDQREEVFYFNMSKAELLKEETSLEGGFEGTVKKIMEGQKGGEMFQLFTDLILNAYGEKSADGKRFEKNQEIRDTFQQSPAFDELITEMLTDPNAAADFVNGIVPKDLEEVAKKMEVQTKTAEALGTAAIAKQLGES